MKSSPAPLTPSFFRGLPARIGAGFFLALAAIIAVYAIPGLSRPASGRGSSAAAGSPRPAAVPQAASSQHSGGRLLFKTASTRRTQTAIHTQAAILTQQRQRPSQAAAGRSDRSARAILSRLDQVGRLGAPIPDETLAGWRRELHAGLSNDALGLERAALLHLWMGEWELTAHEQPKNAEWHLRSAQHLVDRSDKIWGVAAYDRGLVQFAEGDYDAARADFAALIGKKTGAGLTGFNRINGALWMRHASACYGYHAQLADLGIPRPPRLDPLCGAGGLAACLRAMRRPYDKATILGACRVTGRGSNALDLLKACPKLGMVGRFVTADDQGLKLLPKPCIGFVEHDHFVTVLRADDRGIAYLCTDCGAWPGGEVRLDWKQWRALEATGYITVTRKASLADDRLSQLSVALPKGTSGGAASAGARSSLTDGIQVAAASNKIAFGSGGVPSTHSPESALLARHVTVVAVARQSAADIYGPTEAWIQQFLCGFGPWTLQCGCPICCPSDSVSAQDMTHRNPNVIYPLPTPDHPVFSGIGTGDPVAPPPMHRYFVGGGPSSGDPVNLATLQEEYHPATDLSVYNPHGPSVHWSRSYQSLRGSDPMYEYDDFGSGWSQGYNYAVHSTVYAGPVDSGGPHPALSRGPGGPGPAGGGDPPTDPQYVTFPNGSRASFTIPSMPTTGSPSVACSVQAGFPMIVTLYLDTTAGGAYPQYYYIVTFGNQTSFRFDFCSFAADYYPLAQIADRVGNAIDFVYDSTTGLSSFLPVLDEIDDDSTGNALLTINRSSPGYPITGVTDCYGRSVYYQTSWHSDSGVPSDFPQGQYELDQVSQIVATGTGSPPMRYHFGYILSGNGETGEEVNYLHKITTPSPTGSGAATTTIYYDTIDGCFIDHIVDANGNIHQYIPVDGNHTQVFFENPSGTVVYSHTVGFNSDMSQTTDTDGQTNTSGANTHVMYTVGFADPHDPYRPSSLTDAAGRVTSFTWDAYGHLQTLTDARGTVTTETWDYSHFALGRLTSSQTGSKAATTAAYYEPSGLIESVTAPAPSGSGVSTVTASATYDSLGNLLTVTGPGNSVASTVTTTLGYTTDGSYSQSEGLGRPITVTDNLGHTHHTRYDSHWRTSSAWDALGNEYDATYNIADQTLTVSAPATGQTGPGHSYQQAYYQFPGGPASKVRAFDESGAQIREADYGYGAEGEGLSVTGSAENVSVTYDALYRMLTLSDGNSHTTTWAYGNAAGYLSQVTYPDGHSASHTSYDATGRLLQSADENGITANYTYGDSAGDLTSVSYPAHTDQNVSASYDAYGRVTSTTDSQSVYATTYGDRDEMVTGTRTYTGLGAKTITFTYNPDGSRASMQLPVAPSGYSNGNCYTYAYDAGQRLTGITDNLGNTSTFTYGNNNWLLGQQDANGLKAAYTRNALGQGTDLLNTFTSGGTTSSVSEFDDAAYDGVGNLTSVTSSIAASSGLSGTTNFGYDSKDQLTSEANSSTGAGYSNSFAYDSAGNATTFRGTSRSFNSSNQFTGTGFVYDSAGNPTTYAGSTCTFDVFNRATSLGTALTAGYRSDGLRAWKQDSSGNRTYYLYDGVSPLCEMDASGNWKGEFLYGPAGLISHSRASLGTVFFAYDALGSVQSVWRDTGTLVSSRVYDAYGEQASGGIVADSTHDDATIGYNGQSGYITDPETNLVLCGHRYYDPSAGRWLNRDPIGYSGGIGLYNYCANNPVMGVDTSGLQVGFGGGGDEEREIEGDVGAEECAMAVEEGAFVQGMEGLPAATAAWVNTNENAQTGNPADAATGMPPLDDEPAGGTYMLTGQQSGKVMRTGMASNLRERQLDHARDYPDLDFNIDRRISDRNARRGREQIISDMYQPILNKKNPIDPNNPRRPIYMRAGEAIP